MGDRALVVFHDGSKYSPTIYLHWGGSDVLKLLAKLKELMADRLDDLSYVPARFVGLAHEAVPGPLSLGIWNTKAGKASAQTPSGRARYWTDKSHGDNGVFVVDLRGSWTIERFG